MNLEEKWKLALEFITVALVVLYLLSPIDAMPFTEFDDALVGSAALVGQMALHHRGKSQ